MNTAELDGEIRSSFREWVEKLKDFVRIPSVPFDGWDKSAMEESATFCFNAMKGEGFDTEIIRSDTGRPWVYGELLSGSEKPSILFYGHHDVQPPMDESKWNSPPFEPVERNGRLYGRGTADDKYCLLLVLAVVRAHRKTGVELPVNIKILYDGEEEVGSEGVERILRENRDRFSTNAVMVYDADNDKTHHPCIVSSLRGTISARVRVKSMTRALHSGLWSGPVPDPVMGLAKALATLTDEHGRPAVPEMYEGALPPTPQELTDLKKATPPLSEFRQKTGLLDGVIPPVPEDEILLSNWYQPTLTVTRIGGNAEGKGGNVINETVSARISLRLPPKVNPWKSLDGLEEKLRKALPWGLQLEFQQEGGGGPWKADTEKTFFVALKESLEHGFGNPAKFNGCGASIPIVATFAETFPDARIAILGACDPESFIHSENESLNLEDFLSHMLALGDFMHRDAFHRTEIAKQVTPV